MTKVREGYKETEIGVIPEEWEVKKLYEVLDVRDGTHDSPKQKSEGIPLITSKNLKNGKIDLTEITYISEEDHLSISKRSKVDNGDIIFAMIGTIGNPVIIDLDYEFSIKNVALLKFNKTIISNVLVKNLIDSSIVVNQFAQKRAGGVQKFVSLGLIRNIEIPLPPLPEQKRIAEILSTTDAHIENLDKTIEDYQLLKKGMMKKLLTEGIGHTEFKETEIGRIPKAWEVKLLSDLGNLRKGKGIKKDEMVDAGIQCIRYGQIYTDYDHVVYNTKSFISEETAKSSMAIEKGELILAGSGETLEDIGKAITYLGNESCYVGGDTIIFKPCANVDSLFLSYYLATTQVTAQKRKLGQGNSIVHLYVNGAKQILVVLPTLPEQQQIAEILSNIDHRIELLNKERTDFVQLKKSLMEKLLTGKIRTTEINEINN